ncbi:hypothetical protein KQ247_14290 [Ruegeria pomeroyi]|uniref:AAA+ family ATPase n=1 Tax=Ruegeria pomeroyi TaxID=89184 RepID=A0A850LI57_9RHOB|nr:hypothetical protein [Ruegeria pomeroyi]NVK97242.1 hypothetical protein [Ruegeria pomeroyi]NVL04140.1 hypothetical protein [Ruegeria pomeroyi]QWV07992.1 hypothetical protein KQ247_14290 [Ruegeria pomeroyi]HCE70945.1 hypothetical protein [Ruegeria sp.]
MRPILVIALGLMLTAPLAATAQEEEEPGRSLMERGAELFLKGLSQEVEPALRDLRDMAGKVGPSVLSFLEQMGPALADLADKVEDWSVYEMPEMLPNGDIIIRRKTPLPDPAPEQPADEVPKGLTDI